MTYREAYETWLKEFANDRATVDELKAINSMHDGAFVGASCFAPHHLSFFKNHKSGHSLYLILCC